jgi:hypothetical protein
MPYTKTTWVDEILAGDETYHIKDVSGNTLLPDTVLQLVPAIVQAGTTITAARMNNIETGIDTAHTDIAALNGRVTILENEPDLIIRSTINVILGNGSVVITTGIKGFLEIPYNCEIERVTLLANISGSIVVDIWRDTYSNAPPTVTDSICSTAKPTLSSAQKSQDTTLTGWTKTLAAGDILAFNVDSVATIQQVTLVLVVRRT